MPVLRVILIYALFASAWFFFSDALLAAFVDDLGLLIRLETYKGLAFVLITTGLLWGLLHRQTERSQKQSNKQRRLQRQMDSLLEVVTDGVVLLDEQWNYCFVNRAAATMLGRSADELLGKNMWREFPQLKQAPFYDQLDKAMRTQSAGHVQGHVPTLNRWFESRFFPAGDKLMVFFQDTTDEVTATQALEQQQQQLKDYNSQLQTLSHQLFKAHEHERRHIAREMHDEIGQLLTIITLNLRSVEASCPAELKSTIDECTQGLQRILEQVRSMTLDLRPTMLDDLGLPATLRWYCHKVADQLGITIDMEFPDEPRRYNGEVETACFRIAQESLTNIARHAKINYCRVALVDREQMLELTIEDDGQGFDADQVLRESTHTQSFGLLGMKERARLAGGELDIISSPGLGMTVRAEFPVNPVVQAA